MKWSLCGPKISISNVLVLMRTLSAESSTTTLVIVTDYAVAYVKSFLQCHERVGVGHMVTECGPPSVLPSASSKPINIFAMRQPGTYTSRLYVFKLKLHTSQAQGPKAQNLNLDGQHCGVAGSPNTPVTPRSLMMQTTHTSTHTTLGKGAHSRQQAQGGDDEVEDHFPSCPQ
jgi:hypothetical protein